MQELKPASVKVRPKDVMTMPIESYKIEVSTPKHPKKGCGSEYRTAGGNLTPRKTSRTKKKKKIQEILSDVTHCVREVFLLSQFGYRNVYKPERTMPDGTRSWRDTPRHVPEIGIKG